MTRLDLLTMERDRVSKELFDERYTLTVLRASNGVGVRRLESQEQLVAALEADLANKSRLVRIERERDMRAQWAEDERLSHTWAANA